MAIYNSKEFKKVAQSIMQDAQYPLIGLMIAGAHKAGTSSLKEYLGQHPQICTHPQREIAYFIVEHLYQQGYEAIFDRYFDHRSYHQLILAKNVDVMYDKSTINRLQNHNPNMQIVIMLRNPVDRAYSAYWYARRTGSETLTTFEEAITANPERHGEDIIKKWGCSYHDRSEYIRHINNLCQYFPAWQLHIYLMEDLINSAEYVCRSIYKLFDDLDPDFVPNTNHRVNPSALPNNRLVADLVYSSSHYHNLKSVIRSVIPGRYIDMIRNTVIKLNETRFTPPPINSETRVQLIKHFKPYNQQLEDFLGRDLSLWDSEKKISAESVE